MEHWRGSNFNKRAFIAHHPKKYITPTHNFYNPSIFTIEGPLSKIEGVFFVAPIVLSNQLATVV